MFTQIRNLNFKFISMTLFAITFLIGGFFNANVTNAENSGPNISGTAITDIGVGTVPWTSPSNVNILDTNYTTSALAGKSTSNYLKATAYGFNISNNATILGIKVDISRKASLANRIKDTEVKIVKNGTIGATNKADVNNWSYPTESVVSYGGSSDLWGETWTANDINSLNFGVIISVENIDDGATNRTASINSIQITVTYTIPVTTHTLTYTANDNGIITGISPQTIDQGLAGSLVKAVANDGYHFTSWSDGVFTAERTDLNVKADISVTASFAINLSSDKDITSFNFPNLGSGAITGTDIAVTVPFGTDVTTLTPIILFSGVSVNPLSSEVKNFTNPVVYTVTAIDNSTKNYYITVKTEEKPIEEVSKINPTIVWENPERITYGDLLSEVQLNATNEEGISGTYIYTPTLGTKLNADDLNKAQTLSVTFTPENLTSYNTATDTVVINVDKRVVTVIPDTLSKIYGEVDPVLFTYQYSPDSLKLFYGEEFSGVLGRQLGESVGQYWITGPLFVTPGDNYIVTIGGNKAFTIIQKETQTVPTDDNTGNDSVTASTENPEVVVSSSNPLTITVEDGTEATIDVSAFIIGGVGNIPQISIDSSIASVFIPAGTITSADPSWNGVISAPTVTTVNLPDTKGETRTLESAIEVGFADAKLTFEKAVKITMPGQAGKKVGYTRGAEPFTEITNTCVSKDDQDLINADLVGDREDCKIDVGGDLIIWTKHFTTFATYTEERVQSSIGGYILPIAISINKAVAVKEEINNKAEILDNQIAVNIENNKGKVPTVLKAEEQVSVNPDLLNTPKNVFNSNLLAASAGNIMGIELDQQ